MVKRKQKKTATKNPLQRAYTSVAGLFLGKIDLLWDEMRDECDFSVQSWIRRETVVQGGPERWDTTSNWYWYIKETLNEKNISQRTILISHNCLENKGKKVSAAVSQKINSPPRNTESVHFEIGKNSVEKNVHNLIVKLPWELRKKGEK